MTVVWWEEWVGYIIHKAECDQREQTIEIVEPWQISFKTRESSESSKWLQGIPVETIVDVGNRAASHGEMMEQASDHRRMQKM